MRWRFIIPALFLSVIFFLPQLLSTPPGTFLAAKIVQMRTKTNIKIDSLHLSWMGPQKAKQVQISSATLSASCQEFTAYMPLWRAVQSRGLFTVTDGYLRVKSPFEEEASLKSVNARIEASQFTATGSSQLNGQNGSFTISGDIKAFPDTFTLQGQMSSIPTLLLDGLTSSRYQLREILGDFFSAEGSIQTSNAKTLIDINLSSSNGQLQTKAELSGKKIRLQTPLRASFMLTPNLSRSLIKDINPLFLTAVYSNSPIKIWISPDLFESSYDPFEIKDLRIEQGSLDMGRVSIRKGASLESVLKLLQNRNRKNQEEMDAWFTPVSFSIKNKILQTGRLDALLSNSIHICSWGKIHLLSEKLDMYIGLPADILYRSFQIKNLPDDYVHKIPLRGTISNPKLDTSSATAQIASMAATQSLPIPKVGKLFEKITKTASQIKNDKDVPPAKRPFP